MSARVPAAAVVVLAAGCGEDPQLAKADEVARTYLRAAARGDAERVCAMRTRGALREGGFGRPLQVALTSAPKDVCRAVGGGHLAVTKKGGSMYISVGAAILIIVLLIIFVF